MHGARRTGENRAHEPQNVGAAEFSTFVLVFLPDGVLLLVAPCSAGHHALRSSK